MSDPTGAEMRAAADIAVKAFRQVLVWPVQIVADDRRFAAVAHADRMAEFDGPWVERSHAERAFDNRHHAEFVSFMPDVQRFLYGESAMEAADEAPEPSPMRVFRRHDIAKAKAVFSRDEAPIDFDVCRVDLYFFYDIDLAILVVELGADGLSLAQAQRSVNALGRAYPTSWTTKGDPLDCCLSLSLFGPDGAELAASDFQNRDAYLGSLRQNRSPRIGTHWAHLFAPLRFEPGEGGIACRLLEHQQIPQLAYLAIDDIRAIAREDWVRLGLASAPGVVGKTPFAPSFLARFERRYCYDRFWGPLDSHSAPTLRMICSGPTFVMVGDASDPRVTHPETGALARFRHQYFLIGLIVHCHHSALLIFRDRLATAISMLRDYSAPTVRRFKRRIRLTHENFLRFTHRYWFHEVSNQVPAQEVFTLWLGHVGSDELFREVREEVQDMIEYLDSDGLRRQANSVVRLTVVTFFGLIGTVATGFLGMNIFDLTAMSAIEKLLAFVAVAIPVAALTFYTAAKSQRLAEFLEAVSDERQSLGQKARLLAQVWRRRP